MDIISLVAAGRTHINGVDEYNYFHLSCIWSCSNMGRNVCTFDLRLRHIFHFRHLLSSCKQSISSDSKVEATVLGQRERRWVTFLEQVKLQVWLSRTVRHHCYCEKGICHCLVVRLSLDLFVCQSENDFAAFEPRSNRFEDYVSVTNWIWQMNFSCVPFWNSFIPAQLLLKRLVFPP